MAAIFSVRGGSAIVLDMAKKSKINVIITDKVVDEVCQKIKRKYSKIELDSFYEIIMCTNLNIRPAPTLKEIMFYNEFIIDEKDRHVLAGASKYKADYLITLDRKHFFTNKLKDAELPFKIVTPQIFLSILRENKEK